MGMLDDKLVPITGAGRGIGREFALQCAAAGASVLVNDLDPTNDIFLLEQPRPVRSIHRGEGWTREAIAEHAIPVLKSGFMDLARSPDVWCRDPV